MSTSKQAAQPKTSKITIADDNDSLGTLISEDIGTDSEAIGTDSEANTMLFFDNGYYFCDRCDKKIKRKDNFKRHYQQVHNALLSDTNKDIIEVEPASSKLEEIDDSTMDLSDDDDVLDVMSQVMSETDKNSVCDLVTDAEVEKSNSDCSTSVPNLFYDGLFNCDHCKSKIKRKDNFKRHYLQVHKLVYDNDNVRGNSKNKCIFPGCEEIFYHKCKMVDHLRKIHRIVVESETKTFTSLEEFFEWKEKEETSNFVWFPKKDERKISNGVTYASFVCQFNGVKQPIPLKQTSTKRKMVKQKIICPARMLVKTQADKVTIKYIKSHNHQISCDDMRNKPIPAKMKEEITEKLLDNKSVDDVYTELHQEAVSEASCSSSIQKVFIQKHKIRYLQQKLNLPRGNNCKSKILIEDRLKALSSDSFNPVLLYKPTNVLVDPDESIVEDRTFIFAIQTKEQCQLFQQHAKHIVLLELTAPTSFIPYFILTAKVIDEMKQSYNIAHLITSICDDEIALAFFGELKARCEGVDLQIHLVMTTLDTYGVEPFRKVFGPSIQFIYSKWHFHKVLFSKLLADCPNEEELRHQVYFTLVALIEQRDTEHFKVIASDFFHSYKSKCLSIVTFMAELFLCQPEKWALCYRNPEYHHCDSYMHINTTSQLLKSSFGTLKEPCAVSTLLHTLLNIDQSAYLKQLCKQRLAEAAPLSHQMSLGISDEDLNKISDTQWMVLLNGVAYEVNWNSDGCLEEFCSIRCLELLCFGLCQHMYTCNCRWEAPDICPHIHKVHSYEMGVSHCQQTGNTEMPALKNKKFKLYGRAEPPDQKLIERIEQNILVLQQYIDNNPSKEILEEMDESLEHLKNCCEASECKKSS